LLHRLAASLACSAWMMAGMTAASIVYRELPAGARGSATMLGGMFVGMVLGMISGMWLGKLPGAALGLANDGPLARRAWMVIGPGRRLGGADPADAASVPDSLV